MANTTDGANTAITDYNDAKFNHSSARHALMNALAGYQNNTAKGLLIRSTNGREFWIIFVKSYTYNPTSGTHYGITLEGSGMHLVLNTAMNDSNFLSNCSQYSNTSNITDKLESFEFYGKNYQMTLSNLVQNNTVVQSDDISDIDEITLTQFETLSTGLATNSNAMPLS